jgi:hypothetical protein
MEDFYWWKLRRIKMRTHQKTLQESKGKGDRITKSQATGEVFWRERLREDLQDLAIIASRKNEPARPFRRSMRSPLARG